MFHLQARQTATGANPVKSPNACIVRTANAPSIEPVEEWEHAPASSSSASNSLVVSSSSPPTLEQKAQLTAVNSSMVPRSRGGRAKKKKFVSKAYDLSSARPMPLLSTPRSQVMVVTSEAYYTAFATSATVPTYWGGNFTLSQFQDYVSYTSLFDEYKFDGIEVWLESDKLGSSTVASAQMFSVIDLDDGNTPTSIASVLARQGCVSSNTTTGQYHRWVPNMAIASYSGAFTSYSNVEPTWIDCASPAVQHYGLKICVPTADGVIRTINITARARFSFRGAAI